ncbi:MAG TPA: IS1634 family transposase [Nitrospiraceae bacterium]|nr:IS1634 family transposase [Nitrospiraceae bacterium]
MYIDVVPNRNSRPAILLRKAKRVGRKIVKTTLENLTDWPQEKISALRALLQGDTLVPKDSIFTIEKTTPHGHVEAVLGMIKKLKLDTLISASRSRQRDLVLAMLVQRLIHPCSKLATTRLWHSTTLAETLSVGDADCDELYSALDWLLERQPGIEKKLAKHHLTEGSLVLYDVSSSYYEGHICPLIAFGHNRDGKEGMPIIVYGVMTDHEGRPIAVEVYPGNTGDPSTVIDQIEKLRGRFALSRLVLVGDRGMLTQTKIDTLREYPGIGWISALRSQSIRELLEQGDLQLSLFDTRNLAEITSNDYPGERLIACINPVLAEERRRKREELLAATEKHLLRIVTEVNRRSKKPFTGSEIGLKVGRVLNRYKMGKHFTLTIADGLFQWERNIASIESEAKLDGIYIVRTSEPKERISADDTVRHYKSLSHVERAFRCLKGIDIMIRPIRHFTEDHVRAHIFLCMLAYYVEWHMRKALAPVLFDDEELDEQRVRRDPVASAKSSASAKQKKRTQMTEDGYPVHSFDTLLEELGTRCRNRCRINLDGNGHIYYEATEFTPFQKRVFQLLDLFPVKNI